jgi:hypothetical protein
MFIMDIVYFDICVYVFGTSHRLERLIVILLVPVLELEREACFTWYNIATR